MIADTQALGTITRDLVTLLGHLPQESLDSLLDEGFVKWPFAKLDRARQEKIRSLMYGVMSAMPEDQQNEKATDLILKSLVTADVGFAILTLPDDEQQFLAFFAQMPTEFSPTILPVLGDLKDDYKSINSPQVKQQINEFLKQQDSPLPPPSSEKPDVASRETRERFDTLIATVAAAKTDADWTKLIAEHTPVLSEFPESTARNLLRVLNGLPETSRQDLLRFGYLKWRFQKLDPARQQSFKSLVGDLLSMNPQLGLDPESVDQLKSIMDTSDTGFVLLTLPESSEQVVVWYALPPEAPVPIMLPFLSVEKESEPKVFKRSVYKQLSELDDKPNSALPGQ
jgi:hypothetical protein